MSERDTTEDALRDAVHDAFMQFWRAAETEQAAELWAAYCAAQEHYERYLLRGQSRLGAQAEQGRLEWMSLARYVQHDRYNTLCNRAPDARCDYQHEGKSHV